MGRVISFFKGMEPKKKGGGGDSDKPKSKSVPYYVAATMFQRKLVN